MQEKVVETKTCKQCSCDFSITAKDLEFYKKVSPKFNGEVFSIPTPTFCPECRQQRRLSFRNERNLYRTSVGSNKILSIYNPKVGIRFCETDSWESSDLDVGKINDSFFIRETVFTQYNGLIHTTTHKALFMGKNENSEYNNLLSRCKNCYMCFDNSDLEDVYYTTNSAHSTKNIDTLWSSCHDSYEIVDSNNVIQSSFVQNSEECFQSSFIKNCIGCKNCFMCYGLKNKQYHIFNKPYSKDQYFIHKERIQNEGSSKDKFRKFLMTLPQKYINGIGDENVIGDNIVRSKNILSGFNVEGASQIKYSTDIGNTHGVYDSNVVYDGEGYIYESTSALSSYNVCFSQYVFSSTGIYYSYYLIGCSNCFACVNLENQKYCILNKQYSKEDYNKLVPQIIKKMQQDGEWGEFFSSEMSPFGYNETVASEYFPLKKQEALKQGFNWSDYEAPFPKVEKTIPADKLPDSIRDIPDDILNWAVSCEVTNKPFKIIKQELDFYRKRNLPISRRHPDQRHLDRMRLRNPRKLFTRDCDKCNKEMQTSYSSDRPEKVYCEGCYNKEVY